MRGAPAERQRLRANLARLLKPRHIAFIGGAGIVAPIEYCRRAGFEGPIWAVSRNHRELAGLRCFKRVAELPEPPDASYLVIPHEPTVGVVGELAACGAGGAVCFASGFAEIGPEGVRRQHRLVEAAGDLAVVGPNSNGILSFLEGFALWASDDHPQRRVARGVAVLTQSGQVGIVAGNNRRSLPVAYVISIGNQAVIDASDLIEVLAMDPRITAIGLYLESFRDPNAFAFAAASAFARRLPIVAVKSGTGELGARFTETHTGALAGEDALSEALLERSGAVRVKSPITFLETLKMLSIGGLPAGPRLAFLTNSGGVRTLVADRAPHHGLSLPQPTPAVSAALCAQLPAFASVSNPLDYNAQVEGGGQLSRVDAPALERCFRTLLEDRYDLCVHQTDFYPEALDKRQTADPAVTAWIAATRGAKRPAAVLSVFPENMPEDRRERLVAEGVVPLQGIDDGLAALGAAARCARLREVLGETMASPGLICVPEIAGAPHLLDEWQSKGLLAEAGVECPDRRRASARDAVSAAETLGFPVAVKILAPGVPHKARLGAVALDVRGPEAVRAAVARIGQALARARPDLITHEFLIERMVEDVAVELFVGVKRSRDFGLALVIGAGGIEVEVLRDHRTILLPASPALIEHCLADLRIGEALRAAGPQTMETLCEAITRIAAFAVRHAPRLVELDVNPLLVCTGGARVVCADALIGMAAAPGEGDVAGSQQ